MPKHDQVRLRHMLESAREAVSFSHGRTRLDLNHDRMLTLSLVKCIEIIGEAAAKVSPEAKVRYTTIPWTDIISMRNRLIHAYFDIDLDRVWDTITDDLPPADRGAGKDLPARGRGLMEFKFWIQPKYFTAKIAKNAKARQS